MNRYPRILHTVTGFAARRRDLRARLRTERMILDLPREVRKDIGWPDAWAVSSGGPERHGR